VSITELLNKKNNEVQMLPPTDASLGLRNVQPIDYKLSDHPYEHEIEEIQSSKARDCLKKITKFLFSHIGLIGLVVVYAAAGGFLFELLEEHNERVTCQEARGEQINQMTKLKQKILAYIQYNTTSGSTGVNNKDNSSVAFQKIGSMLYDYRSFVIDASLKYRYFGDNCSIVNKWTYPNALLFSITIITTIGYGNITYVPLLSY
jgi:hypothetical protein